MKKICTLLSIVFILLSGRTDAQNVSAELDTLLSRTLDSMKKVVGIKSLSAAIQLPRNTSWAKAVGISSVNPNVDVKTTDAYLIGSVTKTITSACVLQLAEEGKLNLDDSIGKWLPSYQYVDPNITIRQLLRHQSGLYEVLGHPNCQPSLMADMDSIWSAESLVGNFLNPPKAAPGGNWDYCNTNYMLLSMIIKKVTGNTFYQEIRTRFFTPLGMTSIATPAFETLSSPVAHVWIDLDGDLVLDDANDFYMNYMSLNSAAGAAGGYFSTAKNISKWTWTYMRGDLLPATMMAEAKTTVFASGSPGSAYGLGLMKNNIAGYVAYGHGGDLSYSASSWYFPSRDMSISVLGNDASKTSWQLLPVVEALLKTYNKWYSTSSIAGLDANDAVVNVYPSPFHDNLKVQVQCNKQVKEIKVSVLNAMGQVVASAKNDKSNNNGIQVELQNLEYLASGVYYAHVYADNVLLQTSKILK